MEPRTPAESLATQVSPASQAEARASGVSDALGLGARPRGLGKGWLCGERGEERRPPGPSAHPSSVHHPHNPLGPWALQATWGLGIPNGGVAQGPKVGMGWGRAPWARAHAGDPEEARFLRPGNEGHGAEVLLLLEEPPRPVPQKLGGIAGSGRWEVTPKVSLVCQPDLSALLESRGGVQGSGSSLAGDPLPASPSVFSR